MNDKINSTAAIVRICLNHQINTPAVRYPLSDYNWDVMMTSDTSLGSFKSGKVKANAPSGSKQNEIENFWKAIAATKTTPERSDRGTCYCWWGTGGTVRRSVAKRRTSQPYADAIGPATSHSKRKVIGSNRQRLCKVWGRPLQWAWFRQGGSNIERAKETTALIAVQFHGGGNFWSGNQTHCSTKPSFSHGPYSTRQSQWNGGDWSR